MKTWEWIGRIERVAFHFVYGIEPHAPSSQNNKEEEG